MADDIHLDNDDEFDINSMFDDETFTSEVEEGDDNTKSRSTTDNILKSTKNVINEKTSMSNLMDTANESISKAMPSKLSNEVDKIKDIKEAISGPAMEQVKEIGGKVDELLGSAKNSFGIKDDSFMDSMIDKIRDAVRPESNDPIETKEDVDEKIANNVSALLDGMLNKESVTDKKKDIEQTLSNASQEELLSKVVSSLSVANDFNVSVANSYYRKSLELSFKQTLLQDSIFNLLKTNSNLQGKQLEAIVKNTSLPDLLKMHNRDHMEKIFKDKLLSSGMDMLGKNDIVQNLKNNIGSSIESKLSSVAGALDMGNMALGGMDMANDAGMSKIDLLMDTLISGGINKASDKAMKFGMDTLSKTNVGKDAGLTFDKMISDPKHALDEIKESMQGKDNVSFMDDKAIKVLEFLSESMGNNSVNDMKLTNQNPDDVTAFDMRTKTAITNVIPSLLSDIRNEVIGIRTGSMPTNKKIYDYDNGKFTDTSKLKRELTKTIISNNKTIAKDLDSSNLFNIFEYGTKLTKDERKLVKEKYLQHVSEGGTISPYYLDKEGFFDKFGGKLATKLRDNVKKATNNNNPKDVENNTKFVEYSKTIQNSINNSTNNLNSTALRISKLGGGDILQDMGLTSNKDHTKITADKINALNSKVVQKYTTGNVSIDNYGTLTPDEISKSKVIKAKLIDKINKVDDKDITEGHKTTAKALLNRLPLKQILTYETYTTKNIRKLIFDLAKGRIKENGTGNSYMPEFISNAYNNIKDSDVVTNAKNNINKFGEEKLGIDNVEQEANQVEWDNDDIDGMSKNGYKVRNLFKERKALANKKDRELYIDNMDDLNPILNSINNSTVAVYEAINDIKTKELKSSNSILTDMLSSINKIYDLFKPDVPDLTEPPRVIKKVKEVVRDPAEGPRIIRKGTEEYNNMFNGKKIPNRGFFTGGTTVGIPADEIAGVVHGDENIINSKDGQSIVEILNQIKENLGEKVDVTKATLIPELKDTLSGLVNKVSALPDTIKQDKEHSISNNLNKSKDKITNLLRRYTKAGNVVGIDQIEERIDKGIYKTDDANWTEMQQFFTFKNIDKSLASLTSMFGGTSIKNKHNDSLFTPAEAKVRNLTNFTDPNKQQPQGISSMLSGTYDNVTNSVSSMFENNDKINISDYLNLDNDITTAPMEKEDEIDNSKVDLQNHLEEAAKDIKTKGLMTYLKEMLSTESIPADEDALPFYTRIINTIDPLGKLKAVLAGGGSFVKSMIGLHVSAISGVAKGLHKGGEYIKDQAAEKTGMIGGFLKGLVPPQLRFIFDNNAFGRMVKKILPDVGKITKLLGRMVTDNLKVLKDTAKESFTDKDGNVKINLLRGAKFLGKSFVRSAKVTGRGTDGKGGIRGIYGETFKGVGEIGSTALRYGARIFGLEKRIPIYRRAVIIETAPIPEEIKALYFNKKIKFNQISENLSDKDKEAYIKHLSTYKDKKSGILSKALGGIFKSAIFTGEKVINPLYNATAKGATQIGKKSFSLSGISESINSIKDAIMPKKKKYNDKDGDGNRDGGYLDRIKKFMKKPKKGETIENITTSIKGKDTGTSMLMAGIGLLGSALTTYFSGPFMDGIGKLFKNLIWEPIKYLGGKIFDLGKSIVSGVWSGIKSLAMKIPGMETLSKVKDKVVEKYAAAKDTVGKVGGWFGDKFSAAKNFVGDVVSKGVSKVKSVGKFVGKIVPKSMATKLLKIAKATGSKAGLVGKFVIHGGKRIPLLSLVIGTGLAAYHTYKGEYKRAALDMGSAALSTIPFAGTAAGIALDVGGNAYLDHQEANATKIDEMLESNKQIAADANNKPKQNITDKSILSEIKSPIPNKPKLLADLVRDEGLVLHNYRDSLGYKTIGVGHLVEKSKGGIPVKNIIGRDADSITKPEALKILAYDVNRTSTDLYNKLPWLKDKNETVQTDLVNMGFNLGTKGLLGFKNSLKAIKNDSYEEAALNLQDSKWYHQTGVRAKRIVGNIASMSGAAKSSNNVDYKTTPSAVSDIINKNNSASVSAKVEADKATFRKNNMLNKDGTKVTTLNTDTTNTDMVLSTMDKQNKHTETLTKVSKNNSDLTNSILKESLSVQQDMLSTLNGIYTMNKQLVDTLTKDDKEANVGKGKIPDNISVPRFSDNNKRQSVNLKTGTF